jgi:hypothetical protein
MTARPNRVHETQQTQSDHTPWIARGGKLLIRQEKIRRIPRRPPTAFARAAKLRGRTEPAPTEKFDRQRKMPHPKHEIRSKFKIQMTE